MNMGMVDEAAALGWAQGRNFLGIELHSFAHFGPVLPVRSAIGGNAFECSSPLASQC